MLEKKLKDTVSTNARTATTTTARSSSSSPPTSHHLHTSSFTHQTLATESYNNESLNRTIELLR
jgi:hypothetical protein